MKKEKYERAWLDITEFCQEDSIVTSGTVSHEYEGWNPNNPKPNPDSGEYEGWNPHLRL